MLELGDVDIRLMIKTWPGSKKKRSMDSGCPAGERDRGIGVRGCLVELARAFRS